MESLHYGQVYPTSQAVYVGSTVNITCSSHAKAKWTKNGKNLKPHDDNECMITLYHVTEEDSGTYYCHGNLPNNITEFTLMSVLYVGGNSKDNSSVYYTT